MRIGIKCEIHACTIAFAKTYLQAHLNRDYRALLDTAFTARKDAQYYVNRHVQDEDYDIIMKETPLFLVTCKDAVITQEGIASIRRAMKKIGASP